MFLPQLLFVTMVIKARDILRICPTDIYAFGRRGVVPSPSKEHIVPQKYLCKKSVNDPHNIFVCTSLVNSNRGILPFGVIDWNDPNKQAIDGLTGLPSPHWTIGGPDLCVKNRKIWMPPVEARGAIARACLYMRWKYPSIQRGFPVVSSSIIYEWHLLYPPKQWELERHQGLMLKFGIPPNPFIVEDAKKLKGCGILRLE